MLCLVNSSCASSGLYLAFTPCWRVAAVCVLCSSGGLGRGRCNAAEDVEGAEARKGVGRHLKKHRLYSAV
jgi:hypothetical protein